MLTEERGAATFLGHTGPRLYITFNRGPVRCGTPSVSLANAMHGAWAIGHRAIAAARRGRHGALVVGRVVGQVAWDASVFVQRARDSGDHLLYAEATARQREVREVITKLDEEVIG